MMQRPPFPSSGQPPQNPGNMASSYFDNPIQPPQPPVFHPSQGGISFPSGGPSGTAGSLSSSLTFTPSGSVSGPAPSFKNIKASVKTLTENFENVLSDQFKTDAAFLQHYIFTSESNGQNSGSLMETDAAPNLEQEGIPDAEIHALIQELLEVNAFSQTATQASMTARYMPQTAPSHLDPALELPHNLDNPTLSEIQQMATIQIGASRKYRKIFSDLISGISAAVQPPTEAEMNKFLEDFRS